MTNVTQIRSAGGAGPADSLQPLRLDVVMAAEKLCEAWLAVEGVDWTLDQLHHRDDCETALVRAVERLRRARERIGKRRGMR